MAEVHLEAVDAVKMLNRAALLGYIPEEAVWSSDGAWWEVLISRGASPSDVADLAKLDAWFPPEHDEQEFNEFVLGERLLRFRDFGGIEDLSEEKRLSFWQAAIDGEFLTEQQFTEAVLRFADPPLATAPTRVAKTVLDSFPIGWVQHFDVVPLGRRSGAQLVAVYRFLSNDLLALLAEAVGRDIQQQLANPADIGEWKDNWLHRWEDHHGVPAGPAPSATPADPEIEANPALMLNLSYNTTGVEVVDQLITRALDARATDIHLEPVGGGRGRARFRIDGMCQEVLEMPPGLYQEVIARLKVLAELDVTERRRPQDGHIVLEVNGQENNLRIASVPARSGEKVAIRLADLQRISAQLDQLGLAPTSLKTLRDLAQKPFGMILATGPVGSGKTTTLYSCLGEINRRLFNVMSIEDPVEIEVEAVTQLEVNYALGFDFVAGLRALLRQDPDAILVGEIRDEETARISVRASMTGLRVFSTLHTNDSVGAITALRNFHLSSHLIASSIMGVIAQRLLRRLCDKCRVPYTPAAEELTRLGITEAPEKFKAWRPKGCSNCLNTGYKGRIGVFEIFEVTPEVREMILRDESERAIHKIALENGLHTLRADGLDKVSKGLTSLSEFRRVLNF